MQERIGHNRGDTERGKLPTTPYSHVISEGFTDVALGPDIVED